MSSTETEPWICFYCGAEDDREDPDDLCSCLPTEPPVEEYDIAGDR